MNDPLAVLSPSLFRRYVATAALFCVGVLALAVGITKPPESLMWQIYMLGFGAVALWAAYQLWQATSRQVILTVEGLFDSDGQCLVAIDNVEKVERGVFAFKPSNGFTVVMKTAGKRSWAPGLWWRVGRRLGVGGVTPASQGKFMAEMLAIEIATSRH